MYSTASTNWAMKKWFNCQNNVGKMVFVGYPTKKNLVAFKRIIMMIDNILSKIKDANNLVHDLNSGCQFYFHN